MKKKLLIFAGVLALVVGGCGKSASVPDSDTINTFKELEDKAERGEEITIEDAVDVIDTVDEVLNGKDESSSTEGSNDEKDDNNKQYDVDYETKGIVELNGMSWDMTDFGKVRYTLNYKTNTSQNAEVRYAEFFDENDEMYMRIVVSVGKSSSLGNIDSSSARPDNMLNTQRAMKYYNYDYYRPKAYEPTWFGDWCVAMSREYFNIDGSSIFQIGMVSEEPLFGEAGCSITRALVTVINDEGNKNDLEEYMLDLVGNMVNTEFEYEPYAGDPVGYGYVLTSLILSDAEELTKRGAVGGVDTGVLWKEPTKEKVDFKFEITTDTLEDGSYRYVIFKDNITVNEALHGVASSGLTKELDSDSRNGLSLWEESSIVLYNETDYELERKDCKVGSIYLDMDYETATCNGKDLVNYKDILEVFGEPTYTSSTSRAWVYVFEDDNFMFVSFAGDGYDIRSISWYTGAYLNVLNPKNRFESYSGDVTADVLYQNGLREACKYIFNHY